MSAEKHWSSQISMFIFVSNGVASASIKSYWLTAIRGKWWDVCKKKKKKKQCEKMKRVQRLLRYILFLNISDRQPA